MKKIFKVDLDWFTASRKIIYDNLFVVAENQDDAGIKAKAYIALNPQDLKPVNVIEVTAKELLASCPRTNIGLVFPHKNGKNYPIVLPKLRKPDTIELDGDKYHRIAGAEGVSDCNGNIYGQYYNERTGLIKSVYVADYDDYIDQIHKLVDHEQN